MTEIWYSLAANLTLCSVFYFYFWHNTCVRKQTRDWDMMLDRRRGRLIECAAKHKLFTWPNRTIWPWISVICPCWSLHWLCFICLHYSFQSSWLAPTSWTQAANSTSCIFADDPVVQILYLQYQPVGSNVSTAGSNWYSRLYKVPLHPYDQPTTPSTPLSPSRASPASLPTLSPGRRWEVHNKDHVN